MTVVLPSPTKFVRDFNSKGRLDSLEAFVPISLALCEKLQAMYTDEALHNHPSAAKAAIEFALMVL